MDLRANKHGSVRSRLIADLSTRVGAGDLFEWIETKAEELGVLHPGAGRGPITLSPTMLRARNVRRVVEDPMVQRARIVPGDGGFQIRLNPSLPVLAQRFAIAHELGHTFWFASSGETTPLSPCQSVGARDPEIEMLCDRFAAALLLPRQRLFQWLRAYGVEPADERPCFELLTSAARAFSVAEQAVARRLYVDLRHSPLAIVWSRRISRVRLFDSTASSSRWETSWCAVPEFVRSAALGRQQTIALKSKRRIPDDMVPKIAERETIETHLDRRWSTGVTPQPRPSVRKKLDSWDSSPPCRGFAWRGLDRVVVGIPLDPI